VDADGELVSADIRSARRAGEGRPDRPLGEPGALELDQLRFGLGRTLRGVVQVPARVEASNADGVKWTTLRSVSPRLVRAALTMLSAISSPIVVSKDILFSSQVGRPTAQRFRWNGRNRHS
jgi:hypothetical protein